MKLWQKNALLILLVVILAAVPLWLRQDAEFGGADGQAEAVVEEVNPAYQAWFAPVLEPASGEVESMLFAVQAAIGSGVVCFIIGRLTAKGGKSREETSPEARESQA